MIGDRLNPILVKEIRQALKSRQFTATLSLVLLCCCGWSFLGVAWIGPAAALVPSGPSMFYGYYLILAVPLLVVVPYGAFRSLADERQERTHELVSITTLTPRQIVGGKLASAGLQMILFLPAVAPCLAFTYLLRGIDLPAVLLVLFYTVLASTAYSVAGLVLGTLGAQRAFQAALSVVFVGGLLLACFVAVSIVGSWIGFRGAMYTDDGTFWWVNAIITSIIVAYMVLGFLAATAGLTFAADNRSTALRVAMLLPHAVFVGMLPLIWRMEGRVEPKLLYFVFSLLLAYWYAMGALMSAEMPELSARVRRQLPQSLVGRMFLTWFNPGPATGYVFAVASMGSAIAVAAAVAWTHGVDLAYLAFALMAVAYLAIYLGAGLLVLRALRKVRTVGLMTAVLVHAVLLVGGFSIPATIHWSIADYRIADYSPWQIPSLFWTLTYIGERGQNAWNIPYCPAIVGGLAVLMLMVNLRAIAAEMRQGRVEKPVRVAEEDDQLLAARRPRLPKNPWET